MKAINSSRHFLVLVIVTLIQPSLFAEPPRFDAQILQRFPSADAYQGIAVDGHEIGFQFFDLVPVEVNNLLRIKQRLAHIFEFLGIMLT